MPVEDGDSRHTLVNQRTTLIVNGVQDKDGGDYSCTAINKAGNASRTFVVRLSGPPIVDKGQEELDVTVGDSITLTCNVVSGTGNINVSWIVDGKPVGNGRISPTVEVVDRRIQVSDARLSDSGKYICVASNEAGEARKTFDLSVLGQLKLNSSYIFHDRTSSLHGHD